MIANVKVIDLHGAVQLARSYENNHTAWISVLDIEDEEECLFIKKCLAGRKVPHFHRYFRDMDDTDLEFITEGPTRNDVEYLIDVLKGLKNDGKDHHLVVNCYAGISRSTAVAMIAWMIQGYQPEVALEKVFAGRRVAWPNERILRLYDEIVGADSAKVVADWKKEAKGGAIILTDNLETWKNEAWT